ncbi:hypothetical protein L596_000366 [Steinernema carpocapsae]|uniref:Uncharacterized protein n=1 Tax=Steinernema carpocapsae TaxID=34508 RepID=A0A4U8UJB7_STECR|nr:hypothetical protein L596_000366 [Steinernema carpocapsae]
MDLSLENFDLAKKYAFDESAHSGGLPISVQLSEEIEKTTKADVIMLPFVETVSTQCQRSDAIVKTECIQLPPSKDEAQLETPGQKSKDDLSFLQRAWGFLKQPFQCSRITQEIEAQQN